MELIKHRSAEEHFHNLVKKFLTKNDNYDVKKFIGGMPVTLEQKDMFNLLLKGSNQSSKYTVTQKVDGTRVLMHIGLNMDNASPKQRVVSFIDRNMKVYTLRDSARSILPYVNTRQILLDGELVFFDQDGNSHKELESRYVKGISFMAFDILFGPENIDVDTSDNKVIGQEFSMVVPEDGNLRTFKWPYINRYDILHKLIMPSKFNKNAPILTEAFKDVNWFNVELKPIYFLDSLKNKMILYNNTKSGYLQTLLSAERKAFYEMLKINYQKVNTVFIKKAVTLDGLIFTASDTLYTIGNWDKFMTTQYKWKPVEKQTVDLLVKKLPGRNNVVQLFISKGGRVEPYQYNYKPVIISIPQNVRDDSIVEFSLDSSGKFVFEGVRPDKNTPNSLRTVLNVLNSFRNPVNINDLYYFLNINSLNKNDLKKVLSYSSSTKLINCIAKNKDLEIIDQQTKENIKKMIDNVGVKKETEFELRLGRLTNFFNPKLSKYTFESIMSKLQSSKFTREEESLVDMYNENKIRTRYIYSSDFGKYIFLESIIKNRVTNLNMNTYNIIGFDIRASLSTEINIKEYATEGKAYNKYRVSYTEPNKKFKVDFTAVKEGQLLNREFVPDDDSSETTYQIEIELLSNDIDIDEFFKFTFSLVSLN